MNTMDNEPLSGSDRIAGAVLRRIREESIEPRPRWHFLMREGVIWALGAVSIVVGALAVAGILFELRFAAWDLYLATHESFFDFVFDALPFVWLVLFGLFGTAVCLSVRHTRRGYRYPPAILIGGSFVASCVVGSAIFLVGAGRFVDESLGRLVPLHQPLFERERMLWSSTEKGRISGVVIDAPREGYMGIEGPDRVLYRVDMSGFEPIERTYVRAGDHVRVIGVPTSTPEAMFGCAVFIRPDDVLMRAARIPESAPEFIEEISMLERKILFARTTPCKDVRPFTRLLPKQPNSGSSNE
jgi:hypothetical protein